MRCTAAPGFGSASSRCNGAKARSSCKGGGIVIFFLNVLPRTVVKVDLKSWSPVDGATAHHCDHSAACCGLHSTEYASTAAILQFSSRYKLWISCDSRILSQCPSRSHDLCRLRCEFRWLCRLRCETITITGPLTVFTDHCIRHEDQHHKHQRHYRHQYLQNQHQQYQDHDLQASLPRRKSFKGPLCPLWRGVRRVDLPATIMVRVLLAPGAAEE